MQLNEIFVQKIEIHFDRFIQGHYYFSFFLFKQLQSMLTLQSQMTE